MSEAQRKHVENCYGCSPNNPIGLKICFEVKENLVIGEFQSNKNHEGPPGLIHGGIIAAILDEALAYAARYLSEYDIRTMKETITFRKAVKVGEQLRVEARILEEKSRAFILSAKVFYQDNIIAEAEGTLLKFK